MNIYLLELGPKVELPWDSYNAHVVQAETPRKARKLCPYGDEGDIWEKPNLTSVRGIGWNKDKKESVILSSFNAG